MFTNSTRSNHSIFIPITIAVSYSSPMYGHCFSFSKHNIFSAKAKNRSSLSESLKRSVLKTSNTLRLDFQKLSLTFSSYTNTMQNGTGEVAEVSYCYYSQDSHEIVWKFPCMEVAKFTNHDQTIWDVLPAAPHRRFWSLCPAKG